MHDPLLSDSDYDFFLFHLQVLSDMPECDLIYDVDERGFPLDAMKLRWLKSISEATVGKALYAIYNPSLDAFISLDPQTLQVGYFPQDQGFYC